MSNKTQIQILNKKSILLIFALFFLLSSLAFAIPNSLTLQGKLTNLAGTSQQGTFNFTFKIYDNVTNGNELWAVINQSVTTDANGIYDVILTGINLTFADQYYLGIAVQGENESKPRINLTSAPYSFRANTSEALNPNASYFMSNLSVSGHATIGNGTSTILVSTQSINITRSGNLSLAGNITLGDQIVFRLGEIIDNLVDGWLKVTGALNITSSLYVSGNANITGLLTINNLFNVSNSGSIATSGNLSVDGQTFFVDSDTNKIGVNTTVPANTLTVQGTLNVTSQPTRSGDLFVASSGNLGIGTTSPGQALHVVGSTNVSATVNAPVINTTLVTQNVTITSAAGSVIIRLG